MFLFAFLEESRLLLFLYKISRMEDIQNPIIVLYLKFCSKYEVRNEIQTNQQIEEWPFRQYCYVALLNSLKGLR